MAKTAVKGIRAGMMKGMMEEIPKRTMMGMMKGMMEGITSSDSCFPIMTVERHAKPLS